MKKLLFIFGANLTTLRLRHDLVNAGIAWGWDVYYALPAHLLEEGKRLCPNVHFITYKGFSGTSTGLLDNLKSVLQFRHVLKQIRPDAVFFGNVKPNVYGGWLAARLRIKRIYGLVSGLGYAFIDEPGLKRHLFKHLCMTLYKHSFKHFTHVFFQNHDDCQLFQQRRIVTRSQASVVPGTGVDLQQFTPQAFPATLTFLMVARLIREKGVLDYLQAAHALKKQYPQVQFLLGGAIDTNPSALSRDQLRQFESSVRYIGWVEDMPSALAQCSVFVYPSYYREGIPRALLEAIACGRPIITTDAIGCREALQIEPPNGLKVSPKDVSALIQAMEQFIVNPEHIARFGQNARESAKRFDIHAVNRTIYQTLERNS